MSFTINTNMASLQAQMYLQGTNDFQSKTLNRVTSGLRIVQAGDDAAGLAIANGYRSDQAVLTQGVRNANDALSQLQIMDGGMSNISKLLARLHAGHAVGLRHLHRRPHGSRQRIQQRDE
jgi:flagellin